MDLEVEGVRDLELIVRAAKKPGQIPSYMGARMPLTTHLADRVRAMLVDRAGWARFPDDVREWLESAGLAQPTARRRASCWSRASRTAAGHYTVYYTFEGWNANQSLGMLITRRMEDRGPCSRSASSPTTMRSACGGCSPVDDPGGAALARYSARTNSSTGSRARTCCAAPSARWR